MESVLDDCLAQFPSKYVRKNEQRQAVLGLLGQKDMRCCGGSSHKFWEKFHLPVVRGSKTQTKRKGRGISCIAITKYYQ